MNSENLPIFKSAMGLALYIEQIVRKFEKYHKYTIGVELREYAKQMIFIIHRANISKDKQEHILKLKVYCEDMKMLLIFAKNMEAFGNFKQFEHSSKLCVEICRQAQGWVKAQ